MSGLVCLRMESQKAAGDSIVFPGQDSVEDTTSRSNREDGAKSGPSTGIIVVSVVVVTLLLAGIVFFIYRSDISEGNPKILYKVSLGKSLKIFLFMF